MNVRGKGEREEQSGPGIPEKGKTKKRLHLSFSRKEAELNWKRSWEGQRGPRK